MPGTPAHVSDGELLVSADRVEIRWAHEGEPKAGDLVLRGPAPSCRADFRDGFHAAGGMVLHGCARGAELIFYGTYAPGDGSPDWGWRIALDWSDPEHFTLRMFNVLPDGLEAVAVDLRGARAR